MMKRILAGVIAVLIVSFVGLYFITGPSQKIEGKVILDDAKTFVITGANLRFFINGAENPVIKVKEGDKVRIEFTSTEGFHDWVVDEFGAATEKVNAGGSTFVEFTADKKGTFEYYCSVGKHRENGMKGVFIVE